MTDEDKILVFCGWLLHRDNRTKEEYWFPPDRKELDYGQSRPPLDINFYFKYAVPKLLDLDARVIIQCGIDGAYVRIENYFKEYDTSESSNFYKLFGGQEFEAIDKDPAEAFGHALLKLLKEKE